MAAVVETFMTLGENSRTSSRQSMNPTEVIDVDLLNDEDIQIVPPSRRPRPRHPQVRSIGGPSRVASGTSTPETIDLVDDSDEEGPSTSSGRRGEFLSQRLLLRIAAVLIPDNVSGTKATLLPSSSDKWANCFGSSCSSGSSPICKSDLHGSASTVSSRSTATPARTRSGQGVPAQCWTDSISSCRTIEPSAPSCRASGRSTLAPRPQPGTRRSADLR